MVKKTAVLVLILALLLTVVNLFAAMPSCSATVMCDLGSFLMYCVTGTSGSGKLDCDASASVVWVLDTLPTWCVSVRCYVGDIDCGTYTTFVDATSCIPSEYYFDGNPE